MVFTALFAALICVMTAFVHIPTNQGYIHAGDGIIFLAAAVLPAPYAMLAGAIGAGFSDYLSGYAMWVLPTMIIKAASAAVFSARKDTIINNALLIHNSHDPWYPRYIRICLRPGTQRIYEQIH